MLAKHVNPGRVQEIMTDYEEATTNDQDRLKTNILPGEEKTTSTQRTRHDTTGSACTPKPNFLVFLTPPPINKWRKTKTQMQ